MNKYGGQYLEPTIFFSDHYINDEFNNIDFWNKEKNKWGHVAHEILHKSYFSTNDNRKQTEIEETIYISTDGVICCKLKDKVKSDEEALRFITNHINSFLATINFGGIYCFPITEQQVYHINYNEQNKEISIKGGGGNQFFMQDFKKLIQRHQIPKLMNTEIIDFDWVGMRIIKKQTLLDAYENGKILISELGFKNNEHIIALEVYTNYGLNKWINVLILGWTFIEILIDKIWGKYILKEVNQNEINRKNRLNDVKSYSASIRTELLYIQNILDLDNYNTLNQLRKLRNDFVHKGIPIIREDVISIFSSTRFLISKLTNQGFHFHSPGWSRTGGWTSQ